MTRMMMKNQLRLKARTRKRKTRETKEIEMKKMMKMKKIKLRRLKRKRIRKEANVTNLFQIHIRIEFEP